MPEEGREGGTEPTPVEAPAESRPAPASDWMGSEEVRHGSETAPAVAGSEPRPAPENGWMGSDSVHKAGKPDAYETKEDDD